MREPVFFDFVLTFIIGFILAVVAGHMLTGK